MMPRDPVYSGPGLTIAYEAMTIPAPTRRVQLPVLSTPAEQPPPHGARTAPAGGPRIGVLTLGCDKNTVDSERLLARLAGTGARVVDGTDGAEVVVINTCGFIDVAKEESVSAILDAIRLKQAGTLQAVVAVGCLVQRYKAELLEELPEVDLFLGLTEAERLVPELRARGLLREAAPAASMERPLRLPAAVTRHTSYLKISEGCDHGCAFCAIPLMRGRHRSTPMDVLVREAQELEAGGVVELNLISQDTTWYGRDRARGAPPAAEDWFVGRTFAGMPGPGGAPATSRQPAAAGGSLGHASARRGLLPQLLRALLDATSIPWLRLFYMYPSGIHQELVELIAAEPRIVPYLDMPIQHGSDAVLRRMRRPERQASIRERVARLRDAVPDLALRTTVIVGFPGETDEEFEDMLGLLEEIRFDHLGGFAYSAEDDTAAARMPDQVAESLKRERLERLLDVQRAVSQERSEAWLGREVTVLIDSVRGPAAARGQGAGGGAGAGGESGGAADARGAHAARGGTGRTARQALEVDGTVQLDEAAGIRPGQFVRARLADVVENDFTAEITGDPTR
jgi:ribosomal protein S12 methylthiotransferase